MTTTTVTARQMETDVRLFAAQYPTPNVRRMVQLCESGRITWAAAYELARKSLAAAMADAQQ